MIIGLKGWNDGNNYFTQTNNPFEEVLRKTGEGGHLETCGPTAAVNILAARGDNIQIKTPGGYLPQPEQVLAGFLNDPVNYEKFKEIRPNVDPVKMPGNRVPQYYPYALSVCFGVFASFNWGKPNYMKLKDNKGFMVCLIKPGHYIAITGYDTEKNEWLYNDPWPGNKWPGRYAGKSGFCRRLTEKEFDKNVQKYYVEIGGING